MKVHLSKLKGSLIFLAAITCSSEKSQLLWKIKFCNYIKFTVFADRVPAGKLLKAAKELEIHKQLLWIGSDAWASRESVVEDREEIVEGAIAIQPLRRKLKKYNDYFK